MAAPLIKSLRKARLRRRCLPLPTSPPTSRPRCIASYSQAKAQVQSISHAAGAAAPDSTPPPFSFPPSAPPQIVAHAAPARQSGQLSPTYFEATGQTWMPLGGGQEPVDPNKAKLGKSTSF